MGRPANPRPYHKTVTRHETSQGKRCKATDWDARKITTKTRTYYADVPGLGTISLETADEHQAWINLRDKLREAKELALGIIDQHTQHARTEIDAHVDQWAAVLRAKGTTADQIELAANRLKRLARLAKWKRLHQITHDAALLALAKVQTAVAEGGLGKSASTRNHYLGHLKAFVAWAHDGGRMRSNPVRRIEPVNTESDRRHPRRAPDPAEIAELCRYLQSDSAPERRRLSAEERRLGYLVSAATGFRAGELRALVSESFRLEEGTVTVPAGYSKRRRQDTQRLPAWLIEELRGHFEAGGQWRWGRLDKQGPGKVLKADLAAARQAWIGAAKKKQRQEREKSDFLRWRSETPEGPRFFDYHSLRHGYNSAMANLPGMDLKTLLTLTRLSSAELALKTYAHAEEQRIRAAVDQIPRPEQRSD